MSDFTDYDVIEAMLMFGGSFVSGLGKLYRLADPQNQAKLRAAFPEYFAEYLRLAELQIRQAKSREAAEAIPASVRTDRGGLVIEE